MSCRAKMKNRNIAPSKRAGFRLECSAFFIAIAITLWAIYYGYRYGVIRLTADFALIDWALIFGLCAVTAYAWVFAFLCKNILKSMKRLDEVLSTLA